MNLQKPKNYSKIIIFLILILPFIFFSTNMNPWSKSKIFFIQESIYPFQYSYYAISNFIYSTWNNYIKLHNAAIENTKLKNEISLLKTQLLDYTEKTEEIKSLKKFLDFYESYPHKLVTADIISSPVVANFYSLRISKGYLDGLKIGMPVVSEDGVVGKIIRTGLKFSDVQIITDINFSLDILIQRNRVRAILSGSNEQDCIFYIHHNADIKIGDILITSGLAGTFPKGLPVGRVKKISYSLNNVSQIVHVEPFVEYQKVEKIFIIVVDNLPLNKIAETTEDTKTFEQQ